MKYLIWSIEQNRWWNWASNGYRKYRDEAGRYTEEEAIAICRNANLHVREGEPPKEAMVPLNRNEI